MVHIQNLLHNDITLHYLKSIKLHCWNSVKLHNLNSITWWIICYGIGIPLHYVTKIPLQYQNSVCVFRIQVTGNMSDKL